MPRQIYPGQSKFRSQNEAAKLLKQRADTRTRIAKLRANQSKEEINRTILLQAQRRENQRQQQYNSNYITEKQIAKIASERYKIDNSFYLLNIY